MRRTVTFDRRPMMSFALMLAVVLLILATTPSASASAIESSTLILESLTITPASGSITFSSSNVVADAFVNSIVFGSESDSDFNSGVTSASAHAAVTSANAASAFDSSSNTGFSQSNVSIPYYKGVAYANAAADLFENFSITGTSGPVSVQTSAILSHAQFLMVTPSQTLFSRLVFAVTFFSNSGDISVLGEESRLSAAGNSTQEDVGIWNLSNSVTLMAGQQYGLSMEIAAHTDTQGLITPEPVSLCLFGSGILGLAAVLRRKQALARRKSKL